MKTVLNVKTDADVKKRAQALARHLGVPLSTVVNAYLKEFLNTGELKLSREPILRPEVEKRINKHILETKKGCSSSKKFNTVNDALVYLKS